MNVRDDIVFCAFRYALGRRTYITAVVAECLIENRDGFRSETRRKIIEEIKTAIAEDKAGDKNIDVPIWERVIEELREKQVIDSIASKYVNQK